MRPHEIFASMPPEQTTAFFGTLSDECPAVFQQAVHAASLAMKSRPRYLLKQPLEKQALAVRRALARVAAGPLAEEILASYFIECRKEVLEAWLDRVGLEHENGVLKENAPEPPDPAQLAEHVAGYLDESDDPDRPLLLRAFGAQSSIDWPELDGLAKAHPAKA
ncbi:MAG: hypothetical protein OSB70_05845 [Myxococcota bacterium]|jgi:hypothetical protein|nr:hypothetical protein [Myxococcota bacterium]